MTEVSGPADPLAGEPPPFNRQKTCRHGQMLYNVNDRYVGRSLDLYGEFSEGEVDLFRQVVRPGDWVLDVGANIGAHTLFLARHVGPWGRVLAFEPQRLLFETLCANMALNSIRNAWCYPCAVGAEPGEILVPQLDPHQQNNFGGLGLDGQNHGEPVPVLTIDGLHLPHCDFIKIDVEGMEQKVLAGAIETIARFKPILCVENDRHDRSEDLIRFLSRLGYALYWHKPPLYNPNNFASNAANVFGEIVSFNMLCVHRSRSACIESFTTVAGSATESVEEELPQQVEPLPSTIPLESLPPPSGTPTIMDKEPARDSSVVLLTADDHPDFAPLDAGRAGNESAGAASQPRAPTTAPLDGAAEDLHGRGVRLINAGKAEEALPLLRRAVEMNPQSPDYHHNLGVALAHKGRLDEAVASFREALRLKPEGTSALSNLGLALAQQGKIDEAAEVFRDCLCLQPEAVDVLHRLGNVLRNAHKAADALPHLQEAVRLRPESAELQHSLGLTLADLGKSDEAIAAYREALRLQPKYPDALNNLGIVLQNTGKSEEAIECYRKALRLRPHSSETYNNLGVALAATAGLPDAPQHRHDDAIMAYRSALQLYPESAAAYSNLGNAFRQIGLVDDALTCLDRALQLNPNYAEGHNNKAVALVQAGQPAEAVACYDRALELKPDYPDAYLNRALAKLLLGDYGTGLEDYEWRWKRPGRGMPNWGRPLWDGSDPVGRVILLWGEQGLGDSIQYCRYAAVLATRGAIPLLCVPEPVVRLLRTVPGVLKVESSSDKLPPFACHAPLMSFPRLFKMRSLDEAPAPVPYLAADPAGAAACRERVRVGRIENPSCVVGVVWRGNPQYAGDKIRSVAPELVAPLAKIPGVRVVSLMKEGSAEECQAAGAEDIGAREWADFAEAAAAFVNLDLVISVDTAAAHLAGALGIPVWIALPSAPDMRWGLGRDDSPWYPTARLFRQQKRSEWEPVFSRIADELALLVRRGLRPTQAVGKSSLADGLHSRGLALLGEGKTQEAAAYLEDAVRLKPDSSAMRLNLGVALAQLRRLEDAIRHFRKAVELDPSSGLGFANLGLAHVQTSRYSEAAEVLQSAARLDPKSADVQNHLGIALAQLGRDEEAAQCYARAIELRPQYHAPHTNRGNLLRSQGRLEEALACYAEALRLCPSEPDIYNNRAIAFDAMQQTERALADYDRALALNPAHAETRFNRSLALLLQDDYQRGLEEYEWRWRRPLPGLPGRSPTRGMPDWGVPLWDGSVTPGKALLVWSEQGLGDVIHCCRFAPLLAERGLRIFVQAPAGLVRLLQSLASVAGVVGPGEQVAGLDAHVPVMSLPRMWGMKRLDDAPGPVPYLKADVEAAAACRERVRAGAAMVVGVAWRGNPSYAGDRTRSAPAAALAPLWKTAGINPAARRVRFVSVMKEATAEECAAAGVEDIGAAGWADFAEAAAAFANLDLVISVDTAAAHLAGALGLPVWIALPVAPDWRWGLEREDSPWYPTARLFRQETRGQWEPVFQRMASLLDQSAHS